MIDEDEEDSAPFHRIVYRDLRAAHGLADSTQASYQRQFGFGWKAHQRGRHHFRCREESQRPTKVSLDSVLAMAQEALDRLDREVQDYTATILKRERIQNKLGEESKVVAKIREAKSDGSQKLEVYLRFETPASARGREVLWRDGKNENKLIAHEAGYLNIMRAHLDPQGVVAMLGNGIPSAISGFETC